MQGHEGGDVEPASDAMPARAHAGAYWRDSTCGCLTGVNWGDWLARDKPIDPYMVWADLRGEASYAGGAPRAPGEDGKWPLIIELAESWGGKGMPVRVNPAAAVPKTAQESIPWFVGLLEIPAAYLSLERADADYWRVDGRYLTARVRAEAVPMLLCAEGIDRFQLGLPRIPQPDQDPVPTAKLPASGTRPRVVVGIIDDGCAFAHPSFAGDKGAPRVRYLWDQDPGRKVERPAWLRPAKFGYGAELTEAVLKHAASRSKLGEFAPYEAVNYGSFKLDPQTQSSSQRLELRGAKAVQLPAQTQMTGSHGTAVMSLAAGNLPPWREPSQMIDRARRTRPRAAITDLESLAKRLIDQAGRALTAEELESAQIELDAADQWDIVFVQLPTQTVADTSGGSLAVHALDGIRYIVDRAYALPYKGSNRADANGRPYEFRSNPVVINLSWGSLAGAHDGTSIFELALADITRAGRVWVVAAAGNAHRSRHHAQIDLAPGESRALHWLVTPDNPVESYLEIWLPDVEIEGPAIADRLQRELIVEVTTPTGQQLSHARCGSVKVYGADGEPPESALIFARRVVQGKRGTMVLLATAATRTRATALHGEWIVGLSWGTADAPAGPRVQVHAWCERNDLVFGTPRAQQARVFADRSSDEESEFDPEVQGYWRQRQRGSAPYRTPYGLRAVPALSSVGGAPPKPLDAGLMPDNGQDEGAVLVVGAFRRADGEVSRYASGGPGRGLSAPNYFAVLGGKALPNDDAATRLKPDLDAPADQSVSVPGLRTLATVPEGFVRLSGTSAAAALVTRTIANIQYWRFDDFGNVHSKRGKVVAGILTTPAGTGQASPASRATLTPKVDDAFRRGELRLR